MSQSHAERDLPDDAFRPRPSRPTSSRGVSPPRRERAAGGSSSRAVLAGVAFVVIPRLFLVGVFIRLMNYELRRDEHLYVPPARLLDDQALYADFFYNHPPGSAWWFHSVRLLLGTDHLLLSGRLGVFAAWLLFAAAVGALVYVLTRSRTIALCIAILSMANNLFLTQPGMSASNNFLPLPFSLLGLGLFILGASSRKVRPGLVLAAGFLLAFACSFKINAVAFIPAVALAAFLLPRSFELRERVTRIALPLAAGGVLGAAPIFIYLLTDGPRFIASIIRYHLGPHAQRFQAGSTDGEKAVTTLADKLMLAHELWFGTAAAVALSALALVAFERIRSGRARSEEPADERDGHIVLVAAACGASALLSFLPTPSFSQYFAPPLICVPLGLAVLAASLSSAARERTKLALAAAALVAVAAQVPRLAQYAGTIANPERWTVMRVHAKGVEMARRLAGAGLEGKVATLAPLYPLEGGLRVYPELATGPFAYRTAAATPPELAAHYRMVSPAGIAALFESDPPAALLLGFEPELERPMLAFAEAAGYQPAPGFEIVDRYGSAYLYLRSKGADGAHPSASSSLPAPRAATARSITASHSAKMPGSE